MTKLSADSIKLAMSFGAVSYSPAPMRAVRGLSFTYEQLDGFAQAIVNNSDRDDAVQDDTVLVSAQALEDVLRTIHGPTSERAPQDAAYRNAVLMLVEDLARAQQEEPAESRIQHARAKP